ncbi:MAG TPA: tetratricopeptide repeat protein [Vicinamibacterales bacterium]|nr:tetratricopeptide repeat protein [Vicinamibacterales bacterium]
MARRTLHAFALAAIALTAACSRPDLGRAPAPITPLLGTGHASTSRDDLAKTIAAMRAKVAAAPGDATSAVTLADALLRQTRVSGNAGLASEAERVLGAVLERDAGRYDARRMLAATYLSQHRFSEALREAQRCRTMRPDDAWVYGVIGDAHVERGEYDAAFDAFDRMAAIKPTAAAYARVSYARELQGDLREALRAMQMATEATSPLDPESLAWHHAQLGHLHLEMGRLPDARREFSHADHVFRGHPFAGAGLARVAAADGHFRGALDIVTAILATTPTPADLAFSGDMLAALGRRDEAERQYRLAEAAWRTDMPEPSRLARFLAERGRRLEEAIAIGEGARVDRNDIFTADALAWAYFQTGRLERAQAAIAQALRTGSRDRVIRFHAAAIAQAMGDTTRARAYLAQAIDGLPRFDPVAAPRAASLRAALEAHQVPRR